MKIFHALLLSLVLGISGCDAYTDSIATKAKDILQSNLNTDAKFSKYKMHVTGVNLVGEGLMKFEGIAKVEMDGTSHDVPISVSSDFSNILVQTKPGGFLFILEKEMNEAKFKLDQQIAEAERENEKEMNEAKAKLDQQIAETEKEADAATEKFEKDMEELKKR
jgi:hypothetical protein